MRRALISIGLALLVLVLVLLALADNNPVSAVARHLPLGWWQFLKRNLREVTINWNVIGMGLVCSGILIWGGNWLLSGLHNEIQKLKPSGPPRGWWRWKWTFGLYAAVWLLFAIAFSAGGLYRHVSWLVEEKQPWYQARPDQPLDLGLADEAINTLLANSRDLEKVRSGFHSERNPRRPERLLCEDYETIFYVNDAQQIEAYLIIPRNSQSPKEGRFYACLSGKQVSAIKPLSELPSVLKELNAKYAINRNVP